MPGARPSADAVAALWRPSGPGTGAFASLHELDPSLDLYASSWALRLTKVYQLALPAVLDEAQLAAAFREVILNSDTIPLPRLEVLRLAVSGARDLDRPVARDEVAAALGKLKVGSSYALATGAGSSAAALSIAIDIHQMAGIPVPPDVLAEIGARFAAVRGSGQTLQELADETLPTWVAADATLTPAERVASRAKLGAALDVLWGQLRATRSWDGPTISLAASAVAVSRANDISVPDFGTVWAGLERDDGLLRVTADYADADLQTTYFAAEVGRPLPALLPATLSSSAGRRGWQAAPVGGPGEAVMALEVLRAMHLPDHRDELARTSDGWLASLKTTLVSDAALREHLPGLAMWNALRLAVGRPTWMPKVDSWNEVASWDPPDLQQLARCYLLSGVRPPPEGLGLMVEANLRDPLSMEDALGIHLVGVLAKNTALQARARQYAERQSRGELYADHLAAPIADLRSTAIAYAISGRTSFEAARHFDTTAGFAMAADQGPTAEAGTLESTFLTFGLATGFDNVAAIP